MIKERRPRAKTQKVQELSMIDQIGEDLKKKAHAKMIEAKAVSFTPVAPVAEAPVAPVTEAKPKRVLTPEAREKLLLNLAKAREVKKANAEARKASLQ